MSKIISKVKQVNYCSFILYFLNPCGNETIILPSLEFFATSMLLRIILLSSQTSVAITAGIVSKNDDTKSALANTIKSFLCWVTSSGLSNDPTINVPVDAPERNTNEANAVFDNQFNLLKVLRFFNPASSND